MSGAGRPLAIWLTMDQIFCLAPSIRPPMLPVVSRQKTTSTWGVGFFRSTGAAVDGLSVARTAKAARAAARRRVMAGVPGGERVRAVSYPTGRGPGEGALVTGAQRAGSVSDRSRLAPVADAP